MNALRQILTIIQKDMKLEVRDKQVLTSMLVFALLVVVLFQFIFDLTTQHLYNIVPGILWVVILFAGNIGFNRTFAREQEHGRLHGLLLCPIDKSCIYIAKVVVNIVFITVMELLTIPLMMILYDWLPGTRVLSFMGIIFLGSVGFAGVGTIFSAISANTKSSEVMLPILLFPITIPVILAATKSTIILMQGQTIQAAAGWLQLLFGFDIIFLAVSFLLYEYVLEE